MSSLAALAHRERSRLCDLMGELGADAPTLAEGWDVLDLAAHLVARDRDLWSGPGLVLGGAFARAAELARQRRRRQGLDGLVTLIRRHPPLVWNLVPAGAHLNEYYLHHEDVRRANGLGPRRDRDLDEALARLVRAGAARLLRGLDAGVDLVWNGGVLARHGPEPRAVLSGPPGELLLYLTGRRGAAQVALGGDAGAAQELRSADLRL